MQVGVKQGLADVSSPAVSDLHLLLLMEIKDAGGSKRAVQKEFIFFGMQILM